MEAAFSGCTKLILVSSPHISMDFHNAPSGHGREKHHSTAIRAASNAGIKHVYYLSLAFSSHSKAGVMRAHNRTETLLYNLKNMKYTVIREGLFNESWPLYFGHYFKLQYDHRKEIVVAGDGPINWTAISDLGLATALIITDSSSKYEEKTIYLSASVTATLADLVNFVSETRGFQVSLKIVSRDEYIKYYVEEHGMDRAYIEWWATTYDALKEDECLVTDTTFDDLLSSRGVRPQSIHNTVKAMLGFS